MVGYVNNPWVFGTGGLFLRVFCGFLGNRLTAFHGVSLLRTMNIRHCHFSRAACISRFARPPAPLFIHGHSHVFQGLSRVFTGHFMLLDCHSWRCRCGFTSCQPEPATHSTSLGLSWLHLDSLVLTQRYNSARLELDRAAALQKHARPCPHAFLQLACACTHCLRNTAISATCAT